MEPPELLRRELAAWRGDPYHTVTFDSVWPHVVKGVLRDCPDPEFWRKVFAEQREAWRRAYEREPMTPAEWALARSQGDGDLVDVDNRCEHCDSEIVDRGPRTGGPAVRYCSDECRAAAAAAKRRRGETMRDFVGADKIQHS
jgi:hypothetical protein